MARNRTPTNTHTHTRAHARARARERERWLYTQKKKRRKKIKEKKRVGGGGGGGEGRQKKRPRTRSYYQDTKCICQDIPVEPQALPLGNLTLHTVVHTLSQPLTLSCTSSSSWQGRSPTHNAHLEVIHSLSLHPFNQSCTIYHQYITISTEGLGYAGDTDDTLTMWRSRAVIFLMFHQLNIQTTPTVLHSENSPLKSNASLLTQYSANECLTVY